jgi:transcriptional regulator with XRE-family HTH domain
MAVNVKQMGYQRIDGERLRELREDRAFSTRDLAELSNVSSFTINQAEIGKRSRVQPRTLRKLAQALNVLPRELMVREDDEL